MTAAVKVRDLSFSYRTVPVFSGVSFETGEGTITGIAGPNGSGKTTLIRCINGILAPGGEVSIFGTGVREMDRTDIAKVVAYVPQVISTGSGANVFDTVLMGRKPHIGWRARKEDHEKAYSAMELVDVAEFAFRGLNELSGGERQRVMIARAIAQETPIMLMDEPTSSLDIRYQMNVMEIVRDLSEERKTSVIISVHDLNLASRYCDDILILNEGKVCGFGTPSSLLNASMMRSVYGIEAHISNELEHPYIVPLRAAGEEDSVESN